MRSIVEVDMTQTDNVRLEVIDLLYVLGFFFVFSQQPANPPEIYIVDVRKRRPVAGESSVSRLGWLLWLHACGAHLGVRRG